MKNKDYVDLNLVEDLEVDGVNSKDYPDFCDAFFSAGQFKQDGKELTTDQLDWLTDNHGDIVNEMAQESFY